MFRSILVVCVGNICRSPTAEYLLRHRLAGKGIEVSSAGLGALVGNPMDPTAEAVLADHGITGVEHSARQLEARDMYHADIVLVMEKKHRETVLRNYPESAGKVFLLGKWQNDREITDPYKQARPAFEHAHALIHEAVDAWVQRLPS